MQSLSLVVALSLAALGAPLNRGSGEAPLNVVLLVTDDQRPDTIAALGNKLIKTPNIDKLVQRGFAFRQAHTMGSYSPAVCYPSRTQLMSGLHMFHAKDVPSGSDPESYSFPRAMHEAGYATLRSGKDSNYPKKLAKDFDRDIALPRTETCAQQHVDNGIAFIRENAGKRPFFLDVEFGTPHDPQPAPAEYYAMYRPEDFSLPINFLPYQPFDNGDMILRDEATLPWPRTKKDVTGKLARYYASITYTDAQIGRLMAALEETGQMDRTLIIFCADNGSSLGEHGLLGKQNVYENGGMSVPLIFAGPKVIHGESSVFTYLFDIFPTVCELAGINPPNRLDGKSLSMMLWPREGRSPGVRDQLFLAYKDLQRAISDGHWKLIRYPQIDKTQLFDLASDPAEMFDLSDKPEHKAKVAEMLARLEAMQKELGDKCPLVVANPKPAAWSPDQVKLPPIKP